MLKEASGIKRVILACGRTDLRHGIDWPAAMVRLSYGLDPLEEGTLFLFCGVRKDRLKGLPLLFKPLIADVLPYFFIGNL